MPAIIAALLAAFGPLLGELLKSLFEKLFTKAAKNVPTTGDKVKDGSALLTEAIRLTPRIRLPKRCLLRLMRDHAPTVLTGGKMSAADKAEIKAGALDAESDE